jgi:hypothetical protein
MYLVLWKSTSASFLLRVHHTLVFWLVFTALFSDINDI